MTLKDRIERIKNLAWQKSWELIDEQDNICMLSFWKPGCRINVYYSKMTVATALEHPKKGKTQLYRRNVDWGLLNKIFSNPRQHTGKGYFTS